MMNRRRFLGATLGAVAAAPYVSRGAAEASFEIGLVADAQYADAPSKGARNYRAGTARLSEAVEHFNARDLAFCVHLGDLIDHDWQSFDEISRPLARSRHVFHHLLGNHDFEVVDALKPEVPQRLGMMWRYGTFEHGGFRFVVLDTNEVSTYATVAGTPLRAEADAELARLQAAKVRQAKPWNGALSPRQLAWLDRTLTDAHAAGRKVIILAHHPVFPANEHNLWNAADVLALIDRHRCVAAWLNGHNHAGNYGVQNGVPYLTMKGMVESLETSAFATARVLADRIVITGHAREPSRELVFRT